MSAPTQETARLRQADAEARRDCCVEFARPLVLEAGAGTGKTAVLVSRILAWSLGQGWQRAARGCEGQDDEAPDDEMIAQRVLDGIVAFTFTERAAGEMAERLAEWLAELSAERVPAAMVSPELIPAMPEPKLRARRARALLAGLERLSVGTIHGYCRRLLAAHPLAAQRHPSRDEVDAEGRMVAAIVDEVLGEAMPRVYGDPGEEAFIELAAQGFGPKELALALRELVEADVAPASLSVDPFAPQRVSAALEELRRPLEILVETLAASLKGARHRHLAGALAALAEGQLLSDELRGVQSVEELQRCCAEAPTLRERLERWRRQRFGVAEERVFGAEVAGLERAAEQLAPRLALIERLEPTRLRAALTVLPPLLAEVRRRMQARGISTFSALLGDALALLRNKPALCQEIRSGLTQLLVDEFQDTDPTQSALIQLLALDGGAAERPGLMVVGDPKQSIYGWRGAELGAYEDFVQRVLDAEGPRLALTVNFRSSAPILAEVERLMRPVMRAEAGLQPAFAPLLARDDDEGVGYAEAGRCAVEHWVTGIEDGGAGATSGTQNEQSEPEAAESVSTSQDEEGDVTARRARELEAAAFAAELCELHAQGALRWGEVALLLRTTTHQETYLRALRQAGVPFLVERDRSYYKRREVIEASALLRTVVAPGDPIALLALLRSTLVGLPDAALLPLWREGLPALADALGDPSQDALELQLRLGAAIARAGTSMPADVPGLDRLSGWPLALEATLGAVARLRRALAEESVDRWVQRLRRELPLELFAAARFLGVHRLANLERFFERVESALGSGVDPIALSRELRRDVRDAREEQEAPVGDETLDAVRVLTIHRAKGLTFGHVYLLGTHGQPRGRGMQGNEWLEVDGSWEGMLFGAPTLGFHRVTERRQAVGLAEEVRTLYVAITRPRTRLVIAGRWPREGQAGPAGSHVALLARRLGAADRLRHLASIQGADPAGVYVDDDGLRWRALTAGDEATSWQQPASMDLPTPDELRAERVELERRREVAAARQSRPRAAAVVTVARRAEEQNETPDVAAPETPSRGATAVGTQQLDLFGEPSSPEDEKAGLIDEPAVGQGTAETRAGEEPAQDAEREAKGRIARTVGSVVHRVLERLVLTQPLAAQVEPLLRALTADIAAMLEEPDERREAEEAVRTLLERLPRSRLGQRLTALAPSLLGREVPLLLTPEEDQQPTDVLIGSVDLLYRDPDDDRVVVVDFKTDRVPARAVAARAQQHLAQGELYQRAVQRALDLDTPPRLELWFLWPDRIHVVSRR